MATTTQTQILFNSPALHSLKRDQLVKLCKIHSIKANGKNAELIERLKQHAQALPADALDAPDQEDDAMEVEHEPHSAQDDDDHPGFPGGFDEGARDEGGDYAMEDDNDVILTSRFGIPRPSEQWEVVMDDIEEVDETLGTMSSKGSLRTVSNGEFGTHTSKGSVSSSLKALATSLGIKRPGGKSADNQDSDNGTANSRSKVPTSLSPGKLFSSSKARDSLAEHATPYSQLPPADSLPDTDHFKFSTPDASILGLDGEDEDTEDAPVPGGSGRIGKPAPVGARLSMGVGQSTIRLVTQPAAPRFADAYMSPPRLPAIQPDFDIRMGTPSAGRVLSVWPASPRAAGVGDDGEERLYPKLPIVDFAPTRSADDASEDEGQADVSMPGGMSVAASTPARTRTTTGASTSTATPRPLPPRPGPVDVPDLFSPSKATVTATTNTMPPNDAERPTAPRSAPFLFGSPLPRRETPKNSGQDSAAGASVSNTAFEGAAKSVLEEMHRRLAEAQKEKEKNGELKPASVPTQTGGSIFAGLTFGAGGSGDGSGAGDRFAKVHEAEFAKMDSIANHYAARRPTANNRKRKSDVLGPGGPRAGQKRRSSAAGARVISNGVRKKMAVPGGFGGDDDEASESEEEPQAPGSKAPGDDEVEDAGARRSSKRMRITEGWDVHRGQRVSIAPPLPPAEEEKKQREKDAIKRELEAAKARRRSSRGRPSMGGKAAAPTKGKASRFGFLSSAKSIVRNVWNMGAGSKAKAAATANAPPSSIPIAKNAPAPSVAAASKIDSDTQKIGKGAAPKAANTSAPQNARKPSGTHSRIPSVSSTSSKLLKPSAAAGTADAKATGTVASSKSNSSRARSPLPSFAPTPAQNKVAAPAVSRTSSVSGTARSHVSSMASASATSRQSSRTSYVSSMGTRTSLASGASAAVSSIGTRKSLAMNSTNSKVETGKSATDGSEQTARKRTSSLLAPTASSLAKINGAVRPSTSGRSSGLTSVAEKQKRSSAIPGPSKIPANTAGSRMASVSPTSGRIFSQPLTNFGSPAATASPAPHPSLGAAATTLLASAEESSPSKIPRPAVIPPKPKALIARKPRISRSRVIAKLGAQRAAAAQGSAASPNGRTRSSFGARRSFGGVKAGRASGGSEMMRTAAKKRARQSEYMRRRSRATAGDSENLAADDE
ncbi:hypothetical protein PYCCODRAFT_1453015 [Trametes coccinea BRFM310]|uniref:SAP domain-containing protein n=1 Tax=Trametes coccinea (strain BRFM310) TaxID=1353009 RepID=A0A1Y2IIT3_TRAC3|nr:hypothetical protein PYCCODRAFT_1453015 [Trametes coccinea BRFM310]